MLIGKPNTSFVGHKPDETAINDMEFCAVLLDRGQSVEAWTLLHRQAESIPSQFNKAICLIRVEEYASALPLLEQVLGILAQTPQGLKTPESPSLRTIQDVQATTKAYTEAITFKYAELFPETLKDSVLRMMVDCHAALGNHNKVLEIGTPLKSKGYQNVIDAIKKVEL
ncbi:MAG: hypothetical protein LBQ60_13095 [Bacteroidales bacterium]|jgi:hypothetical protein|nr:hypothetical protein [Bacteroidales bacterium]